MKKPLCLLIISILFASNLFAKIKIASILGDNMVLQQNSVVKIWGTADVSQKVTVSTNWNKDKITVVANDKGEWVAKISTTEAGGPYSIQITAGKEKLSISNILLGEVWLCSGQSNMEMPVKGYHNQPISNSNEFIATSENQQIRLFTVQQAYSLVEKTEVLGNWKVSKPENVAEFSATAYFFGKMLQQVLGIPIGLINTSYGGTRIESWISDSGLKDFDWVKLPEKNKAAGVSKQTPTALYNAMIHPITNYKIRGAIWYQGEANRREPDNYGKLLPALVESWRNVWEIGDFPFYFVQIAPYGYVDTEGGLSSVYLREVQLEASKSIPNAGMACLIDIGEKNCVHPKDKKTTGNRLAYLALSKTYGKKGISFSGPVLKEMKIIQDVVKLTFENAPNGLTSFGKDLTCFELAGSNKRFYQAKAIITGSGITLLSPNVTEPVAVRYAFKDFVVGELFNTEGLPASSFRTDKWE